MESEAGKLLRKLSALPSVRTKPSWGPVKTKKSLTLAIDALQTAFEVDFIGGEMVIGFSFLFLSVFSGKSYVV